MQFRGLLILIIGLASVSAALRKWYRQTRVSHNADI
jgi:hypothetical protein